MPRLEDVIITFRTETLREYPSADYRSNLAIYHAKVGLGPLPAVDLENMGPPALARVDLGRWLVDCGDCANAVIVDDLDLIVICPKCGSGGCWREVIMPAERVKIEELLLMRPGFRDANRNRFWFPGESVDQLVMENVMNDTPVPKEDAVRLKDHIAGALLALAQAKATEDVGNADLLNDWPVEEGFLTFQVKGPDRGDS